MVNSGPDGTTVENVAEGFYGGGIKYRKLAGAFVSSLILIIAGGFIRILEAWLTLHLWFIQGLEDTAEQFLGELLAPTGSLAWSEAFEAALEAGPLAPLLLTAEILLTVTLIGYFFGGRS